MTNTQPGILFTVTVESRRTDTHQWDITAQATDTLAGLAEWAAPANDGLVFRRRFPGSPARRSGQRFHWLHL